MTARDIVYATTLELIRRLRELGVQDDCPTEREPTSDCGVETCPRMEREMILMELELRAGSA